MHKMKTCLFLLAFGTIGLTACAQDLHPGQVPSVVYNTWKQQYPAATDEEWELRGNVYEVEFEVGRQDHTLWIDGTGKVLKLKQDLAPTQLPQAVQNALATQYRDYRVDDADLYEENGARTYVVELDGNMTDRKVTFAPDGKVLADRIDLD